MDTQDQQLQNSAPLNAMSADAQRIAIAEACGWTRNKYNPFFFSHENGGDARKLSIHERELPDYLSDLNAMNEAEKVLDAGQCFEFQEQLRNVQRRLLETHQLEDKPSCFFRWSATAAQRAEAFLRTIRKWTDQ